MKAHLSYADLSRLILPKTTNPATVLQYIIGIITSQVLCSLHQSTKTISFLRSFMRIINTLKPLIRRPQSQHIMTSSSGYIKHNCDDVEFINVYSLTRLAQQLATNGPHKKEPTRRRVRGLFNGKYAIDTTDAYFVWEVPNYPQYGPESRCLPSILMVA